MSKVEKQNIEVTQAPDIADEDRHIQALILQAEEQKRLAEEEAKYYTQRSYDTRMNSTREVDERPTFRRAFIGPLNVRPVVMEKLDPDYQYAWLTEKIRNMPDESGVEYAISLGWRPVMSSEIPDMGMSNDVATMLGKKRSSLIRKGGSLFVKMLKKDFDAYQKEAHAKFATNKMLKDNVERFDRIAGNGMNMSLNKSYEIPAKPKRVGY